MEQGESLVVILLFRIRSLHFVRAFCIFRMNFMIEFMFKWNRATKAALIILVVLFCWIDTGLLIFVVMLGFQTMCFYSGIKHLRKYRQVKKGPFVYGEVVGSNKIPASEESSDNYECTIEFYWPPHEKKYCIKHRIWNWGPPKPGRRFHTWVNEINPAASFTTEEYYSGLFTSALALLLSVGFFIPDYFQLKMILSKYGLMIG